MLGLQLGFVYTSGALVPEGNPPTLASTREYVPTGHPGARLPHAWIGEGQDRSTLDEVALEGFTLFSFGAHDAWAEAAGGQTRVPVAHVRVGVDLTLPDDAWRTACGVEPEGALLVRPDQHVAWRSASRPAQPDAALTAALTTILEDPS